MEIKPYSKVWNLGHRAVLELFHGPVVVEEKVDGSQFSFGLKADALSCRSKGKELFIGEPEKMFTEALATVSLLVNGSTKPHDGWVYRCEYLKKPRHNGLAYDRIPKNHLIVYDIDIGDQNYLSPEQKAEEARRLDLECVPALYKGTIGAVADVLGLMETVSCLGGQKIEGLVFKNYAMFDIMGKTLMGKHVSEAFKEVQGKHWKKDNPARNDIMVRLVGEFRTEARWNKAVQHLRDDGKLLGEPADIGPLLKEVQRDLLEECEDTVKERLWHWAKSKLARGASNGLAEWYKSELMKQQFSEK